MWTARSERRYSRKIHLSLKVSRFVSRMCKQLYFGGWVGRQLPPLRVNRQTCGKITTPSTTYGVGEKSSKMTTLYLSCRIIRPVYTKRQSQFGINAAMNFVTQFSLTTMESLENGIATHFGVTPLWSMRAVSQASSQR